MELAGIAQGGHVLSYFSDFELTNAAELEAHVNIRAVAARNNFDKYYAERLADVSKLWVSQKRRLDVREPLKTPVITVDCGTPGFVCASLAELFTAARAERDLRQREVAERVAKGDTTVDLEVDQRVDQSVPLTLKLTGVDYTNIHKVVAALLDGDRPCPAERIDLSNNRLGEDEAASLAELCTKSTVLRYLDISGNPLGNGGIEVLCRGLSQGSTLTDLDLGGTDLSKSGAVHLGNVLKAANCNLERLQLGGNKLGIYGAEVIAEALAANRSLRALGLQNNNMGDDGLQKLLVIALSGANRTLSLLNVDHNRASDSIVSSLLGAAVENERLQQLLRLDELEHDERAKRMTEIEADLDLLRSAAKRFLDEAAAAASQAVKAPPSKATVASSKTTVAPSSKATVAPPKATVAPPKARATPTKVCVAKTGTSNRQHPSPPRKRL